jgi:hypothetical protein
VAAGQEASSFYTPPVTVSESVFVPEFSLKTPFPNLAVDFTNITLNTVLSNHSKPRLATVLNL